MDCVFLSFLTTEKVFLVSVSSRLLGDRNNTHFAFWLRSRLVSRKMSTIYKDAELRYFRLAKGVIDYSASALRKVFKEKWKFLYPFTPWQNDGKSVSQLIEKEKEQARGSRLYDPAVRDTLSSGDIEEWDVTALVFALCQSQALRGIRCGPRWRLVNAAILDIKNVRNKVLSHASEASISLPVFQENLRILVQAVEKLLTSSDPLVEKLKKLLTEREFVTEDLLVLEKHLERLEYKANISATKRKRKEDNLPNSKRSKFIATVCLRMKRVGEEFLSPVDLAPSRTKPAIFQSARYIRMINESSSMSYNFRWEGLDEFLRSFNDDVDMQMFAGIQAALSLSHQSKKDKSLEMLNELSRKALTATNG